LGSGGRRTALVLSLGCRAVDVNGIIIILLLRSSIGLTKILVLVKIEPIGLYEEHLRNASPGHYEHSEIHSKNYFLLIMSFCCENEFQIAPSPPLLRGNKEL